MNVLLKLPSKIRIRKLGKNEHPPWDLLLKSCPSQNVVQNALDNGICYVAILHENVVGAFVLVKTQPSVSEIMYFTTAEKINELAKTFVTYAIEKANGHESNMLEIGVGNSSFKMLELFQKSGFRIKSIIHDYYLQNYERKIIENGILCRDMIRLSLDLKK